MTPARPLTRRRSAAVRVALSAAIAVFVAMLVSAFLGRTSDTPGAARAVGLSPAPPFSLPLLNQPRVGPALEARLGPALADGRLELTELRGVPAMIDVWASWCPSCREQAPELQRAWREDLRPRGVLLVGLNIRDVPEDARQFIRHYGIDFPNVRDAQATIAARYGVTGIPKMFPISRSGQIVEHVVGSMSRKDLRTAAARLVSAP
jgi:cytochrome c biogenesis protein CcmG/thiol:disulfide interchange protein DsbE